AVEPPVVGGHEEAVPPGDGGETDGPFGKESPLLPARLRLEGRDAVVEGGPHIERLPSDDGFVPAVELETRGPKGRLERRERPRPEEVKRVRQRRRRLSAPSRVLPPGRPVVGDFFLQRRRAPAHVKEKRDRDAHACCRPTIQ